MNMYLYIHTYIHICADVHIYLHTEIYLDMYKCIERCYGFSSDVFIV